MPYMAYTALRYGRSASITVSAEVLDAGFEDRLVDVAGHIAVQAVAGALGVAHLGW